MTGTTGEGAAANAGTGRVRFEQLRERTDELELIISGISLFALLALPDWLLGAYVEYVPRFGIGFVAATTILLPILSAICYLMAVLLLLHLLVRAHWVGLVGLKTVHPDGVRWERIAGIGPLTTRRLRERVGDLDGAIVRADARASVLFSLILFSGLALAVLGAWMTLLFMVAGVFGNALGGTNAFLVRGLGWLFGAYVGVPLLRWLLDGVLLRHVPACARFAPLRWLVHALGALEGLMLPTRLLGLTRLTLQSHLLPRTFFAVFLGVVLALALGSNMLAQRWLDGGMHGHQGFLGDADVAGGLRSRYYESLRVPRDRLRRTPTIPAPLVETAWLPLFLPYVGLNDDPVLALRCPGHDGSETKGDVRGRDDSDAAAIAREADDDRRAAAAADCLRRLWEVRLNGIVQPLDRFIPAERADLGLRGLAGWLPLNGLAPGPQRLEVIWRPRPEQDALREDWIPPRSRHVIPFVWSPEGSAMPGGG